MQTDGKIIYVAGNPDLYPLEYYDAESQTYQGAIPEFLAAFAREYGYDLRYFQPGPDDRRADLAEYLQVDLISGCEAGDRFDHTDGEPLILFESEAGGEEAAYALFLTQVSPSQFQADLREYAARTSQEEWTGAILRSVDETPQQQVANLHRDIQTAMKGLERQTEDMEQRAEELLEAAPQENLTLFQ